MRKNSTRKKFKITLTVLCGTALTACTSSPDDEAVVEIVRNGTVSGVATPVSYGGAGDRYGSYPASFADGASHADGYEESRRVHQLYGEARAEALDGQCEPTVTVARGDTLSDVAEYCDTTVAALLAANRSVRNPHELRAGERIVIPQVRGKVYEGLRTAELVPHRARALPASYSGDTATYTVRYGDTVSGIAARHGVPARTVLALNPLIDPHSLRPGQELALPTGVSVTPRQSIRDTQVAAAAVRDEKPVVINIGGPGHVQAGDPTVAINIDQPRASSGTVNRVVTTPVIERTVSVPAVQHTLGQPGVHYEVVGALPTGTVVRPSASATGSPNHVSRAPVQARQGLRYEASLPRDGRSYSDLGTACMRIGASGEQEVYRVNASAGGPDCNGDRPVKLYKAAN